LSKSNQSINPSYIKMEGDLMNLFPDGAPDPLNQPAEPENLAPVPAGGPNAGAAGAAANCKAVKKCGRWGNRKPTRNAGQILADLGSQLETSKRSKYGFVKKVNGCTVSLSPRERCVLANTTGGKALVQSKLGDKCAPSFKTKGMSCRTNIVASDVDLVRKTKKKRKGEKKKKKKKPFCLPGKRTNPFTPAGAAACKAQAARKAAAEAAAEACKAARGPTI
jgi:hypothetical protein